MKISEVSKIGSNFSNCHLVNRQTFIVPFSGNFEFSKRYNANLNRKAGIGQEFSEVLGLFQEFRNLRRNS
jgi:hypothetical protein